MVVGRRGGESPLFTKEGTVNPKLSKTDMKTLGTECKVLIAEKDKEIEELHKSIREDEIIADNDNEDQQVRERARERITEKENKLMLSRMSEKNSDSNSERERVGWRGRERESKEHLHNVYHSQ